MDGTEKQSPVAKVTIMAGIPGSGKSTLARRSLPEARILSTDDFWINGAGEYEFDAKRLTEAHGWNLRRFLKTLRDAYDDNRNTGLIRTTPIVVDNTNTRLIEIAPYYQAALAFGASVEVLAVTCDWTVAASRQEHPQSDAKVYQMHLRFEEMLRTFPGWWKLRTAWSKHGV